ncbi:MAG: hypothetical protein AABX75_01695 [Nanoarchaeota archaeon]
MAADIAGILIDLLSRWGSLFAAPLKDYNLLWIIVPIYLNWIFSEFYQEKKGTSFGNAITNGATMLWVGIDWMRTTVNAFLAGSATFDGIFAAKVFLSLLALAYALAIIIAGIKTMKIEHIIGRVRLVTYFSLMLTPVIYGIVSPEFLTIAAAVLFAPLFYIIIEIIDKVLPTPKAYAEEGMPSEGGAGLGDMNIPGLDNTAGMSSGFGSQGFSSGPQQMPGGFGNNLGGLPKF